MLNILRVGIVVAGVVFAAACAKSHGIQRSEIYLVDRGPHHLDFVRGWSCSVSAAMPAAGFCTRLTVDCQRARDAAIVAVPDLAECQFVETAAFCFIADDGVERCAPTMAGCAPEVAARGITPVCDERW